MSDQEFNRFTQEEILEMLPAFVVGALDSDEMLEVQDYLDAHPELLPRMHELELAAAKLAYAAPPQQLPPGLYSAVMNRAHASTPPAPLSAPSTRAAPLPQTRSTQATTRPSQGPGWWRTNGLWTLGMATALAALLALAIIYRNSLGEVDRLRVQLQGLENQVVIIQQQNDDLQETNTRLQGQLELQQNQMASITNAQESIALGGTKAAPSASGTLYVDGDQGTLVMKNLDTLPEDQVYQLWLIPADGTPPVPAGLVGRATEPVVMLSLDLPSTLENVGAVGVSIEPPGGSSAPTGPIVLLGEKA